MPITTLKALFSPDQVSVDPDQLREYGRDWTRFIEPAPSAIVFPRSTEDVVKLVQWARANRVALTPSGGRTGLSGGAVAAGGEVVVSFQKMNRIVDFDESDQTVRCEAGVITEQLQKFADEQGLLYPVDFAARGSCQIGGNVATNAGGIKVLRYGLTRQWVAGLEAVTGAGQVLNLNKALVKNATGYDLRHLLIGSEGTLALVTHVTVSLCPKPAGQSVFVFAVADLSALMKIYHAFKRALPLTAFEMFTEVALETVLKHHVTLKRPFAEAHPYYVLVEFETHGEGSGDAGVDLALELFERGVEEGWIQDGVQAQAPSQARELWRLREDISESTAPHTPYKNDVSVRISKVTEFLNQMDQILRENYPHFTVVWFGHIGDGNLHINILKPASMAREDFLRACHQVDQRLFAVIEALGGSVSAEHGVGLMKKPFLKHSRSAEEISLMRQIKRVFDPDGILNPGKIF